MTPTAQKNLRSILFPAFSGGLISALLAPFIDPHHDFWEMTLAGFIMGLGALGLILAFEKLVKNRVTKKFSFLTSLTLGTLVDGAIVFAVMLLTVLTMGIRNDERVSLWEMVQRQDFLAGVGVFGVMALIMQFLLQVNNLIGQGVLFRVMLGRYHKPQESERFFLFMDVKASTTIAEKIGHLKFHSLLNEFFYDLADAVVLSKGEIYKYVGDEAIVVWSREKGKKNANPLYCFFALKARLEKRAEFYNSAFGLVPDFKGGLHFGKVTVGEMGRFRKEIAYLGDTVNTAARIQGECTRLGQDLLVSGEALDLLELPGMVESRDLGSVSLRGRDAPVRLFSAALKRRGAESASDR